MDNEKQIFNRGNLVELLVGHQVYGYENKIIELHPELIGKKAVIEYSYAEKFGGNNINSYSIIFQETGNSSAWKKPYELKFIEKGGEHLLDAAKKVRKELSKKHKSPSYILDLLETGEFNSESILFLFEIFGYESSFNKNGEFFMLHRDWELLHPVFTLIKKAETLEEVEFLLPGKTFKKL